MKARLSNACLWLVLSGVLGSAAVAVSIETVTVANPGNVPDINSVGAVAYTYAIGKYEVTAGQYTEFLNSVARVDTYGLYNPVMWSDEQGCKIEAIGPSDNRSYQVAPNYANRPVNFVSWADAARFANWMHNGQPSTGMQDATTTEDGSYLINGATSNSDLTNVTRKANATWVIPNENEWYKAAYHKNDGGAGYWRYATRSDTAPGRDLSESTNPGNNANHGFNAFLPYYATPVGAFGLSQSAYGTYDQTGNVGEWNETEFDGSRGMRGGSFGAVPTAMLAAYRGSQPNTVERSIYGFRLAMVPEPGTALLVLSLGACRLARRPRKGTTSTQGA